MPDIPRDPRQLARDILAGKISIEELAREQQRRRAGNAAPSPPTPQNRPQIRPPQTIQIQRPLQQPQRPLPQPPRPFQQPQRPLARKPVPVPPKPAAPKPVQRQVSAAPPTAQARGPQVRAIAQPVSAGQSAIPVAEARGTSTSQTVDNRAKPASTDRPQIIKTLLATRTALRNAIVTAEILNKPLALRDD